ncbi:MAG: M56 family metallopeptidase [Planctomycetes bacterium]|nr:M56 family metallopeptidase [Planctomycetota bacterium]
MTNDLDALAQVVFVLLATYFLHSTCLLIAAWIGTRLFRVRNMLVIERVWKMAAVTGLVTAPLQVAMGIHPVVEIAIGEATLSTSESTIVDMETPSTHSSITYRATARSPVVNTFADRHAPTPAPLPRLPHYSSDRTKETVVEQSSVSASALWLPLSRHVIGSAAACAIAFFGLARFSLQSLRFRHRFRECKSIDSGASRRMLDRLLETTDIRRAVRLESSTQFNEPVAFGVWRWRIILPHYINERLSAEELRALLAHELAHLVRGDSLWVWIGRVLCLCFGFQPLNFLARRRWQHAAEFLCDDWAIQHNANPLALAKCLTQFAEWRLDRCDLSGVLAVTGDSAAVTERVERLVNASPTHVSSGRKWMLPLSVGCAFVLMTVAGPRASWRQATANETTVQKDESSTGREILTEDLRQALAELEQCQHLLANASSPELRELASRIRRRGDVLRRYHKSLSFAVDDTDPE